MSILADWFRSVFPAKRTPQDTQWPRPLPQSVDPAYVIYDPRYGIPVDSPYTAQVRRENALFSRMVHAVNEDRLKATLKPQPDAWRKNFTKTPEQRKADHAKSVATKALKKARTAELRAALVKSVEEA